MGAKEKMEIWYFCLSFLWKKKLQFVKWLICGLAFAYTAIILMRPSCHVDSELIQSFQCRLTSPNASCQDVRQDDIAYFTPNATAHRIKTSCANIPLPNSSIKTPLAFSILVHDQIAILETQLRLLFRPHHTFCIHVDLKAPAEFYQQVRTLVNCYKEHYPNAKVFMVDYPLAVYWGHISLLKADLRCMDELRKRPGWRFAMTIAGTELPLVNIEEMELKLRGQHTSVVHSTFHDLSVLFKSHFLHENPRWWG